MLQIHLYFLSNSRLDFSLQFDFKQYPQFYKLFEKYIIKFKFLLKNLVKKKAFIETAYIKILFYGKKKKHIFL